MKINGSIIVFLGILLSVRAVYGQTGAIKYYTTKDGLPSNTVYNVTQDIQGFIWIGTEAGLVRYDGHEFTTYTIKDGLPDNEITQVEPDSIGRVWIMPYKKNICYYYHGKIFTEKDDTMLAAFAKKNTSFRVTAYQGRGNRMWLFDRELWRIDGDKYTLFPNWAHHQRILNIHDLNDREFIVYTVDSFYYFKDDSLTNVFTTSIPEKDAHVDRIWISHLDDRVFVSSVNKIWIYKKSETFRFTLIASIILQGYGFGGVAEVGGKVYIPSVNYGIYVYNSSDVHFSSPQFIQNYAASIFRDKDNNIWMPNNNRGLEVLPSTTIKTLDYPELHTGSIGCLAVDSSSGIWFGDEKGSLQYYYKGHTTSIISAAFSNTLMKSRKVIYANGLIYFISDYTHGIIYDPKQKKATNIGFISAGAPKSILLSKKADKLLIGTTGSLIFMDIKTPSDKKEIPVSKRITALCEDTSGILYCGSADGLYEWRDSMKYIAGDNELLKCRITSMALSRDNILWIGTSSNGIVAYKDGKSISQINHEKCSTFSGAVCRTVFIDKNNIVWVATNNGLDKIEYELSPITGLRIKKITPFLSSDGLADNDVNDVFVKDSMVYAATARGISIFNYYKTTEAPAPRVYIVGFAVNQIDSPVRGQYNLTYSQNHIAIKFSGISFINDKKMTYRYKLIGSDEKWTYTDQNRLELKSLGYGNYEFIVEALDKFGNPSLKPASLFFAISPPFYHTIPFRIAGLLFFGFIIYGATRWRFAIRRKAEKEKNDQKEKIVKLEQQALRSQMNPHFIFNSLTAIQHFINEEDGESANKFLTSFSRLIRKTLDNSEEAFISVGKDIQYLENYVQLEQMRFQNKFSFDIFCDPLIDKANTFIPVILTQPFVENAIRHGLRYKEGTDGHLSIAYTLSNDILTCSIDDNGVGRDISLKLKTNMHIEYQSRGMKISKDRINALNMVRRKKIHVEVIDKKSKSGIPAGTLVNLIFE